ncbi:MAG: HAD hydrolase-like protein [Lachnospiraceae bacterium]|nr:HAD hydrolase-like protein [Lachnospiraceae bacterium]
MYKYLLFDLDGTLTDSEEGITKSVSYALINLGVNDLPDDIKKRFIGPPLLDSFKRYCGFDDEMAQKAVAKYRERYSTVGKFENRPYVGIPELLKKLKEAGRVLVIASSKPTGFVEDILEKFEIKDYFDIISGADLSGKKSEKEDVIKYALDILGAEYGFDEEKSIKDVVMIGDRNYDIYGAKFFNMDSIGVNYGFAIDKNELKDAGATYVVETVEELENLLLS